MADEFTRDDENLTLADGDSAAGQSTTVEVGADGAVMLPAGINFGNAEFGQSGSDLVVTAPDGTEVVVEGYFDQESAPMLKTPGGAELAGDTATHLARVLSPTQEVAQAAPTADDQPIGQVESVTGTVVAIRANGDRVELEAGDPVFQGDVLQSGEEGAIGIVLADETTFSMAENGRMVLDEMVYDPGTQEGSISMSVLQGVFTFVSGQVAKVDPDAMTLKTPVATIGIRGTQVGIDLGENADGTPDLRVVLMEESDGFVGEVVISNAGGIQILNLPDQGSTVSSADSAPTEPRVFLRSEIRESFSDALDALPTAVGTGNNYGANEEETREQEEQEENEEAAAEEEGEQEDAAEEDTEEVSEEFAEAEGEEGSESEDGGEGSEGEDLEDFETAGGGAEEEGADDEEAVTEDGEVDEDLEDFETAGGGEEEEVAADDAPDDGGDDFIDVTEEFQGGAVIGGGGGSTGDVVDDDDDDDGDRPVVDDTPANLPPPPPEPEAPIVTLDAAVGDEDTAIELTISATVPSGSPGQIVSVTISNIPEGATLTLGGTELELIQNSDGTSSVQLTPDQLTGLTITPALDENADFDLQVSADNFDSLTGSTATGSGTLGVTVDATVDPAVISAAPRTGVGDEDTAIAVDISTELADADGTVTSLTITDIPDGAVLMSGDTVIDLTGPDADGLFSAVLSPDQLTGLTITPDQDDAHDFNLNITATSTDIDPDMVDNAAAQAAVNDAASAQTAEDAASAASDAADEAVTEAQSDLDAAIEARDNPDPEATEAELAELETAVGDAGSALGAAQSDAADAQTAEDSAIAASDAADAVAANYTPSIAAVEAVAEAAAAADAVVEAEATLGDAETAATDAETAEENAIAASDAADLAVTDAETALSDAETALAEAVDAPGGSGGNEAEITALEAAVADAETVLTDTQTAASDAATAETDAIAASDAADVAVTDATTALSDAQTVAETTAAAADDAVIAAADAAVAAEAELATATSDAAEAQAAETDATAASDAADAVVADAQTALDDATTALADANAAEGPDAPTEAEIAELETAVADAGTALGTANTDAATAQATEDRATTASNDADTAEAEAQASYDALTTGHATNTSETFAQTVEVIATVDAPEVATEDASGDEDTAIPLDISATVDEIDIPDGTLESITIGDIPEGATLTYVDDAGATVELTVTDGSVTLSPDQLNGLAITPQEDDANDFDLSVSATAVDLDPDFQIAVDAAETAAADAATVLSDAQSAATTADTAEAGAIAASDAADVVAADAQVAVDDAGTAFLDAVDAGATDAEVLLLEATLDEAEIALTDANTAAADAQTAETDAIAASDAADQELGEAQTAADAADATLADAETALANGEVSNTSEPVNLNVEVIATVDAPEVATQDASGDEDTAIPLDIEATVDEIDIPDGTLESITVTGFPAGASVSYTDSTGATVELTVTDGSVTLAPEQLNGLAVTPAEDDANDFDLTVTATATDTDPDTGDVVTNTSAPVPLAVTVTATVDAPEVIAEIASGDEDTAIPLEITATVDEIGIPDGTLESITIGDIPTGATLTYTDDSGATVELTVTDGSVTLSPEQLTGLSITPLEDDANDFDLTVTATATDTDPDTGDVVTNTSDPVPLSVEVIATVDAPEVFTEDASGDEDTAIPLDIAATVDDIDIPDGTLESITIGDIPAGATLTYVDDTGATVELTVTDGSVTLSPDQLNGLAITPAEDDANDFDLSVSATATDTDPDSGEIVTNTSVPVALAVVVLATAEVDVSAQDASGAENTAIPLDITASVDVGDDTLETVTIGDIPDGATLTYVDDAGVTQEIIVTDGSVTLSPEQLNGLALTPPIDDVSDFALSVSATSSDTDPDTGEIVTATDGPVPLNVNVTGGNVAPEAGDDLVDGIEDIPVIINPETLLANDTDADGDTLEITSVENPVGGTVEIVDGNIVFTPDANYSGSASFDYTVTDGDGLTATATTTVDIEAVADAPLVSVNVTMVSQTADNDDVEDLDGVVHQFRTKDDDSPDINHGTESVYDVDIEAALVDTDGSETLSTIEVTGLPSGATLSAGTLNPDGSWTLTSEQLDGLQMTLDPTVPDDFNLTVTVTSTETSNLDSAASSSSATIAVNLEPDAVDDAVTLNEDAATIIDLAANDTDADGDTLVVTEINSEPQHGTVTINEDGTVTYTPDADYHGSDHFTYTVSDGAGGFDTARANLTVDSVNDAPVAVDDTAVIDEDSSVNLNVMANDSDVDGGEMIMDSVTQPEHGTVTINGNGTVTYTPDANFNGTDSFTYTIIDADGATDTATVNLTVNPGDDVPVAVADVATLDEDSSVIIDALANDSAPDGSFSLDSFTQPEHGLVTVNADGNFVYTPDANFNGGDSFTYTIADADGDVSTAIVSVAVNPVNDPVVAVDDVAVLNEDAASVIDVLANDTAVDGGLELTGVTQPLHGTVAINDDGTVTYTPAENYNGSDSFTYSITDADGDVSTATVSLTINPENDAPVAVDDSATLNEDASAVINVLGNDTDLDGDFLSLDSVTQPEHGTVTINLDGTVTYTPEADYNGTDSFTYTISDGAGGTDTATVSLTVNPENDDPVAVDDTAILAEDSAATLNVMANDTDLDGDTLSLDSVTQPEHGLVTINDDGTVTYTPDANYNGTDSFTYTISDGAGGTDTATVSLTVNPTNDAPVAVNDTVSGIEDTAVVINPETLLANDTDIEGDVLEITAVDSPVGGTVEIVDGNIIFTPDANYSGPASFDYTVTDASGATSTATTSVNVEAVADAPTLSVSITEVEGSGEADLFPVMDHDISNVVMYIEVDGEIIKVKIEGFDDADANFRDADDLPLEEYVAENYPGGELVAVTVKAGNNQLEEAGPGEGQLFILDGSVSQDDLPLADNVMDGNSFSYNEALEGVTPSEGGGDTAYDVNIQTGLTDTDGSESLSITVTDVPDGASFTAGTENTDGSWTFTAEELDGLQMTVDETVGDDFSLTITSTSTEASNDDAASTQVTASVGVNAGPDAADDTATLNEDASAVIDVLANDSDLDGDDIYVGSVTEPAHGTVAINDDGTVTYTPDADYNGADSFTYTIYDGEGNTDTATVSLTVDPQNDNPVAVDATATLAANAATETNPAATGTGNGDGTGAGDGSGDGNSETNRGERAENVGTGNSEGSFGNVGNTNTRNNNSGNTNSGNGNDGNTNAGNNNEGDTNAGNDNVGDTNAGDGNTGDTNAGNNNEDDTNAGNDNVGDTNAGDGNTGDTNAGDNNVGDNSAAGTDGGEPSERVAKEADSEDTAFAGQLSASDFDGDSLNYSLSDQGAPEHGSVTINADGTYSYTPDADYSGTDNFTFTVDDGAGGTDTATVTLSFTGVADDPVVVVSDDTGVEDSWTQLHLDTSLSDTDGSETLSLTISNVPDGAMLSPGTNLGGGDWTVSPEQLHLVCILPPDDYSGEIDMTLSVTSTEDDGDTATVDSAFTVTVTPAGDVTVSVDDVTGTEDAAEIGLGLSTESFSIDDADGSEVLQSIEITFTDLPDGAVVNNATFNEETGTYSVPTAAALAIVSVSAPENWSGDFNVTLEVTSNEGSASQSFGVSVSAGNDAPVIDASPVFSMAEDGVITISEEQLLVGASDVDGDALSITDLVVNGGTGDLAGPDADGNYTYTPPENFNGEVSVEYNVSDGTLSVAQTADITVTPVNDDPVAVADADTVAEAELSVTGNVITNDSDVDGDVLSLTQVDFGGVTHTFAEGETSMTLEGDHGTLTIATDGSYTYEKAEGDGGTPAETVSAGGSSADAGDWADAGVTIFAFDFGTSYTDGDGNFDASGADDSAQFTSEGVGVEGTQGAGQASSQIEYDSQSGDSEALALSFDTSVSSAEVTVSRLYHEEGNDGEQGQWQAFDGDGNLVGTGTIDDSTVSYDGSSNVGTLNIDLGGTAFSTVVFTATAMSGSGSDFKVQGVEFETVATDGFVAGGEDVFTYTVADGAGGTDTAALTITVEADNSAPTVSTAPAFVMNEDGVIVITEAQLLEGASDIDGDALSITDLVVNGGEGTLTGPDVDGNFTYQPSADFSGNVSLNYNVTDGGASVPQTATVAVAGVADTPDLATGVTGVTEVLADTDVPVSQSLLDQVDADSADTLAGEAGDSADTLYGGAGDDALSGEGGDDVLYGGSGDDDVTGGDGDDSVFGGDGMDALYGGSGVDYLSGGEGDDVIYGESGNDIILGGAGDDQLHGGDGDDEFVFNLGDGNDTIFDFGAGDEMTFDGVSLADGDRVDITTDGSDVVITIIGKDGTETNKVTLKDSAEDSGSSADSSTGSDNVGDGYSVTESAEGGVTIVVDQVT